MNDQEVLKKSPLLYYIKKNKRAFFFGIFFLIITNALDAYYPMVLKQGIDQISQGVSFEKIQKTVFLFFCIMTSLAITRYFWRVYFGSYHTQAAEDLRNRVFRHLTQMGPTFFHKNPVGELMSLIVNDVQSFRHAIGRGVLVFVDGIIIVIFILPLMLKLNPSWTWKCLIFLPLVPFLIWKIMSLIHKNFTQQQEKLSELSGFTQETVSGIRVIKTFVQEKKRVELYNNLSSAFENACNRVAKIDALFGPVMQFGVASGTVILLFVAADDVLTGVASIGTLVAFQRYIKKLVWPMTALGLSLNELQKGRASFDRIKNLLDQKTDIPDLGDEQLTDFKEIEVKNLSFRYPGSSTETLSNLNFKIKAGQTIGIVGPIGSGKTTLLNVLTRLHSVQSGAISINGKSLETFSLNSLRKSIVLVPQEAFLFSESILDNVSFGLPEGQLESNLMHKEVERWADVVNIRHEINDLPEKFNSQLGERGVNLSGGQKQRLTIARALIMEAPCILLDDTLSAVDVKTEESIKKELYALNPTQTKVIVAHRLSCVENAEQILVLNQGKIESIGTHQELLTKSSTYQKLAQIQGYIFQKEQQT